METSIGHSNQFAIVIPSEDILEEQIDGLGMETEGIVPRSLLVLLSRILPRLEMSLFGIALLLLMLI